MILTSFYSTIADLSVKQGTSLCLCLCLSLSLSLSRSRSHTVCMFFPAAAVSRVTGGSAMHTRSGPTKWRVRNCENTQLLVCCSWSSVVVSSYTWSVTLWWCFYDMQSSGHFVAEPSRTWSRLWRWEMSLWV